MTKTTEKVTSKKKNEPKIMNIAPDAIDQLTAALSDESKLTALVTRKDWALTTTRALTQLVEVDIMAGKQQAVLGEVYYKFLQLPLDKQKAITTEWAKVLGCEAPTYEQSGAGRPTSGRKELAQVLYHAYPDDLKVEEGQKDSKAARRISQDILVYKYEAGLADRPTPSLTSSGETKKISTPQLHRVFTALLGVATDNDETEAVLLLFRRLGVSPKELAKWEEQSKDEIIDVTAAS